jgi:hypothetical protein
VYDGVADLVQRAKISIVDDTDDSQRYYLPSGYSWTQPKMRFNSMTSLKDNVVEMCKLCERVVYFDENGLMHLDHLQGGLMGDLDNVATVGDFERSPQSDIHVILNEKKTDNKLGSAVNSVFLRTVDRLNGAVYLVSKTKQNYKFPYQKQLMIDQPALGSAGAANYHSDLLLEHFSRTPRGITFSTILGSNDKIHPMDVIQVRNDDGGWDRMRVQSLTRRFNADDNSIEVSLTCEWWD